MNLQLPPDRRLDHPDELVDRILTDTPAGARRGGSRAGRTGLAVAAALVLVATAIGVLQAGPGRPQVGGSPVITAVPQQHQPLHPSASDLPSTSGEPASDLPLATSAPTGPDRPVASTVVGTTLTFPHLSVTVGSANHLRVNNVAIDEYTINVKTCVRSLPAGSTNGRVSLREDSWALNTSSGKVAVTDPITESVPLPMTYPPKRSLGVGQCAIGVIPFGVGAAVSVTSVEYHDQFGDNGSWLPKG